MPDPRAATGAVDGAMGGQAEGLVSTSLPGSGRPGAADDARKPSRRLDANRARSLAVAPGGKSEPINAAPSMFAAFRRSAGAGDDHIDTLDPRYPCGCGATSPVAEPGR